MPKKFLENNTLLAVLGIIAVLGLIIIGFNALKNNKTAPPTSQQPSLSQPKSAKMPLPIKDKPVTGQIIVKFKPGYTVTQINEDLAKYHASVIKTIPGINQTVVKVPAGQENIITQELKTDPYVETTQRDYTTHAFFTPNDPLFSMQYAFNNTGQTILGKAGVANADIHAEQAWDTTQGNGVKVAILDTGINLNQPDLAGKVILQDSFVSNTVEDGNGHGTHVAGILAADTNNSVGVAGTCPGCELMIGKVLDDTGSGTTSNAVAGIVWAANNGAKVISMSLGTTEASTESLYEEAVQYALSKGAIVIAAAGNDDNTEFNYPAAAPGVISVAATTNTDQKASYSNYGSWVQIAAPGDDILSTGPTHAFQLEPQGYSFTQPYYYLSGTSMATPDVSGVAALIATTQYGTTPQAIASRLCSTADKISGTGTLWVCGRVDAAAAVGPAPTVPSTPNPNNITPSIACVGGNGTPPCATIPPPVSSAPTTTAANPSGVAVSPTPNSGTSATPTPLPVSNPTPTPVPGGTTLICNVADLQNAFYNLASQQPQSSAKVHTKCDPGSGSGNNNTDPNDGLLSQLVAFLLQLLEQLLELLLQCSLQTAAVAPTVMPAVSPSP
jgi:thermitase